MAIDLPPDVSAGTPPAAIVAQAQQPEPIHVDSHGFHYVVRGNRLLPQTTVTAAIEAAATPQDALNALNRAFQQAGYVLTAIRGETSGKLVAFNVIHGRLTELSGAPELAPYFSGLLERDDLNRSALIRSTAVAESYSNRQGMRPVVSFAPAKEVGGSRLNVAEEPIPGTKPWAANVSFGNLGSRFSSRYQASAAGSVRPGAGVELTANYSQGIPGLTSDSAGSQYQTAGLGVSVATPLGMYAATWSGITYQNGEASAPLYPAGEVYTAGVNGLQLLYADETTRLVLTQAYSHVDNLVQVFDRTFTLTDQRYDVVSAGVVYNKTFALLGKLANVGFNATYLKGISAPEGTFLPVAIGVPDTRFTAVQGNLSYSQGLPAGFSMALSLSGQWADTTVPQNQQWVIGGFGNLTAWLPAILVGDMGSLGRLSISAPAQSWAGYSLSGTAFVESGIVRLSYTPPNNPVTKTLADAGLSLTGSTPFGTSATLAYAWPIASRNVDLDAVNAQGRANLYFSLSQTF